MTGAPTAIGQPVSVTSHPQLPELAGQIGTVVGREHELWLVLLAADAPYGRRVPLAFTASELTVRPSAASARR